jgi:hypothetical protein
MKIRSKLLLAALTAVVALSLGAGTAAALRSIESSATAVAASGRAITFAGGGSRVVCEVTLSLTLSTRSISKVRGSRVGNTKATVNERACTGGRARPLNTAEGWVTNYFSFAGTLPNITSIRLELVGTAFLVSAFGGFGECLFRGNAQGTTGGGTNRITEIRADSTIQLPLSRNLNGLFCPEEGTFAGTFTVTSPREGVTLRLL